MTDLNSMARFNLYNSGFFLSGYTGPIKALKNELADATSAKIDKTGLASKLLADLDDEEFRGLIGHHPALKSDGLPESKAKGPNRLTAVSEIAGYELDKVGTRLQGTNHDMWDTFDRCKAEAEFRSALVIPLTVLVPVAAYECEAWWLLFLLVAPWWLMILGTRKAIETTSTLVQAISLNYVQPPIFDRWKQLAKKQAAKAGTPPALAEKRLI